MKKRLIIEGQHKGHDKAIADVSNYTDSIIDKATEYTFGNLRGKGCGVKLYRDKVPETFEELKELVRNNVYEDERNGVKVGQCIKIEYILIDGKSFMPDGEILDEDNDVFAQNRTPAQMWQIIKSLGVEE